MLVIHHLQDVWVARGIQLWSGFYPVPEMNFSISFIRPSLAQFAPQLLFCILLWSPALSWATLVWPAGMLHILPIAELSPPDHSHLIAKVDLSKQAGLTRFRVHTFNLMRPLRCPNS